ncbi:GNAT family N-acetyltransferase [Yoonia litorea]|uniref:L-ornithine N(alpha)-acyltransferase n=1 Tax=Yoonia litorea TaxID=1123755 RepID=A0A1I6M5V3_9RHOB|nr:GNAT family N-acyltransferase [Yoonia litorea]SFS11077.1 ornithine-acyl[acyl carrier protein] N-acyltransferase [Yoonia litorea]
MAHDDAYHGEASQLVVRLARTPDDIKAAQRLRYDVFVTELGGSGPYVDHGNRLEKDRFDRFADHLLLIDEARPQGDQVVGVYRLMTQDHASAAGQFYCADEYDLTPLLESDHKLLELGRSCLHPAYRGGLGMTHLWTALGDYVERHEIDVMFGVASFHGTNLETCAQGLSLLHDRHLAPAHLRVSAKGATAIPLSQVTPDAFDRLQAVKQLPALIKGYLRLGGTVGNGAFVDHAFNTIDVCLILEKSAIRGLQKTLYAGRGQR